MTWGLGTVAAWSLLLSSMLLGVLLLPLAPLLLLVANAAKPGASDHSGAVLQNQARHKAASGHTQTNHPGTVVHAGWADVYYGKHGMSQTQSNRGTRHSYVLLL